MLDELRPLGLSEAARHLGVDPFEVVRLTVARGQARIRVRERPQRSQRDDGERGQPEQTFHA